MKFVMNGSLIIGTMDGANVEIAEEIGEKNMFIFGARVEEVNDFLMQVCLIIINILQMRNGKRDYVSPQLDRIFNAVTSGQFGDLSCMNGIIHDLRNGNDKYTLCWDFHSYLDAQEKVDAAYRDQKKWAQMAIEGVAYSGKFSSDRTIQEYCKDIWNIAPVTVPRPSYTSEEHQTLPAPKSKFAKAK